MARRLARRLSAAVTGAALLAVAAQAAAGAGDAGHRGTPSTAGAQHVAVPAYFPPGDAWTQLDQGAPTVGLAVANPDSGPGASEDGAYASAIAAAHAAGTKVIGYVDTGYFGTTGRTTRDGQTSVDAWTRQAEADVDAWYSFYGSSGLDGIFFDDALHDCGADDAHVQLYRDLRAYVRQHDDGATVVDNPGTGTEECYTSAADTLVTFEGSYRDYTSYQPQPWEASASPGALWHLVYHATDQSQLDDAVALAKSRNAGYVYVTPDGSDDGQQNPWDTLPTGSYWSDELSGAAAGG